VDAVKAVFAVNDPEGPEFIKRADCAARKRGIVYRVVAGPEDEIHRKERAQAVEIKTW
jgi:hypothetical protein